MSQYPATTTGVAGAEHTATTTGFAPNIEQQHTTTTHTTTAAPAPTVQVQTRGQTEHVHTSVKPLTVFPFLGFAFLSLMLYMAGLATLQSQCNSGNSYAVGQVAPGGDTALLSGVDGFSSTVLPCSKVYRWSWFVFAFEVVIILGLLAVTAAGRLWHARLAFLSLFGIATILFMLQSESFLSATSKQPWYDGGVWWHRANVTSAGAIMVVVANIFVILAIGIDHTVDTTGSTAGGYGHGHGNKV